MGRLLAAGERATNEIPISAPIPVHSVALLHQERPSTSAGGGGGISSEENDLFLDILHEAPLSGRREPRSIFGGLLYCLLLSGYVVMAAASPWIFLATPTLIPALLCSSNVLLMILAGIFQQYWVHQVKKVRLQGYYAFSQRLKHIARLPFATTAIHYCWKIDQNLEYVVEFVFTFGRYYFLFMPTMWSNNQYIEENERLRAILGEWSARAAKLERALCKLSGCRS